MLGGGGYVAGPVGLAAALTRTPLVLAEADSHLGISNRALASRARRVCLAFPLEGRDGRPLPRHRPPGAAQGHRPRARPRAARDRRRRDVRARLRRLARRALDQPARRPSAFKDAPYRVVHVAGTRDYPDLTSPGPHYVLLDYLTPFGIALAAADVAVGRSGGSVFELAQYGLPSVLIPYPHASADHQSSNARWMADAGAARILTDAELTPQRLRERPTRCWRSARRCHRRRCAGQAGRRARHRTRDPRRGYRRRSSSLRVTVDRGRM